SSRGRASRPRAHSGRGPPGTGRREAPSASLAFRGRELEHTLAGLDEAQFLARDALDGIRVGAKLVDGRGQPVGLGAQRGDLALEAVDLALHLPDAAQALPSEREDGEGDDRDGARAERAGDHPRTRVPDDAVKWRCLVEAMRVPVRRDGPFAGPLIERGPGT